MAAAPVSAPGAGGPEPDGTPAVRVAVVDDHDVVARGLAAHLTPAETGLVVVASARTVPGLLGTDTGIDADVVVLDLDLPDGSRPADNVRALRATGAQVLVFCARCEPGPLLEAVQAGALGCVEKSRAVSEVAVALREVAAGRPALSAGLRAALAAVAAQRPDLSARQTDVLVRYTTSDAKLPTVARQLDMQPETMKTHLRRIKEKYSLAGRPARTRLELYRRAVEDGYVGRSAGGPPVGPDA